MTIYVKLIFVIFVISPAANAGQPAEFGLTPSTVFGIWKNINKAILTYATEVSNDDAWINNLQSMKPGTYSNKVPADVLKKVQQFNLKLHELGSRRSDSRQKTLLESDLSNLLALSDDTLVTPSLVYLYSGQTLIDFVAELEQYSSGQIKISPLFEFQNFSDKTPSDVFGLVELSIRQLDKFLLPQNPETFRNKVQRAKQ